MEAMYLHVELLSSSKEQEICTGYNLNKNWIMGQE
jgi:hypothetical protein